MQDCTSHQALIAETALEKILQQVKAISHIETLPLSKCNKRVLAQDQLAAISVPYTDNSAMDGYALNYSDLEQQDTFNISQRIPAGTAPSPLEKNTAARIFTGAPIPQNADIVIMQEHCEEHNNQVKILKKAEQGANIRRQGEDIQKGEIILHKGDYLNPQALGLAASVGIDTLKVYKKLTIAFFSTGDELIEPGNTLLHQGQLYNSNRYVLHGFLENLSVNILDIGIIPDDFNTICNTLETAVQQADIIITTGGASVGEEDHMKGALEKLGTVTIHNIAIKPGKPVIFGNIQEKSIINLPGNPVSAFFTFHFFAKPLIQASQGRGIKTPYSAEVIANFDWPTAGKRREFLRAKIENNQAIIYKNQSSGVLSSTVWAEGLVDIPANTIVKKGDKIRFYPFEGFLE